MMYYYIYYIFDSGSRFLHMYSGSGLMNIPHILRSKTIAQTLFKQNYYVECSRYF